MSFLSLATRSMEWNYEIPYGIVYAKNPSEAVKKFIEIIQRNSTQTT